MLAKNKVWQFINSVFFKNYSACIYLEGLLERAGTCALYQTPNLNLLQYETWKLQSYTSKQLLFMIPVFVIVTITSYLTALINIERLEKA